MEENKVKAKESKREKQKIVSSQITSLSSI